MEAYSYPGYRSGMSWGLYMLCKYPQCQRKLREELLAVPGDMPDINDLNMLPYLDGVVRETLRLCPAIPYTMRLANTQVGIHQSITGKTQSTTAQVTRARVEASCCNPFNVLQELFTA